MLPNVRFRVFKIQILKFCEKELTKVVPGGVVGATLWKVCIEMYKTSLFARISVFL